MYDRKTWAILVICGSLLAVNLYYQGKDQARQREAKQIEARQLEAKQREEDSKNPKASVAETAKEPVKEPVKEAAPADPAKEELVVLSSPEIEYTLTNIGGGIKFAEFKHEFEVGSKTNRVRANRFGTSPIGALAGSGEASDKKTGPDEALEKIAYTYESEESVPNKKAVYSATLPSGLTARKTFTIIPGDNPGAPYLLDFDLTLENTSANTINLGKWSVFLGEAAPLYQAEVPTQTGFFWRKDGGITFKDGGAFKGGWFSTAQSVITSPQEPIQYAGVTNQFFSTVLRPMDPASTSMWAKSQQVTLPDSTRTVTSIRAGLCLPATDLKPSKTNTVNYRIFIGPKRNQLLRKMNHHWGDGWGDVMQYGWFWFVSRPLNWLLNIYHSGIARIARNWSWGLAIIVLTITVRVIIWPLHAKSTHTMKRMSKLQPEMARIKEKYADDPHKLNTETMGLYRKYGINPLGGCLPMFIQIPVFFGFYRMLQYAVELRGQGFLWVHDLSQPDTFAYVAGVPMNILPVVMAISSFLQIRMTPKTGDAMQQKIIMFMPLMFFFFCYNFASALALYWTTQNIFSIGQTWLMSKVPEPELKPVKRGKSWIQRMTERQAEYQKLRQQGGSPGGLRDVTPDSKKKRPPRTGG